MVEVGFWSLVGGAFAFAVPFLILITIMFNLISRSLTRIETRLDKITDDLSGLTERVAVLEERGRSEHVGTA